MTTLTLVVNTGGQSRRMGQDKALLPVPPAGGPLLAHVVTRLVPLQPAALVVVTNNVDLQALVPLPGAPWFVADTYAATGTLGGIATGLRHTDGWALVVACDLPLVSAALCRFLWEIAQEQLAGARSLGRGRPRRRRLRRAAARLLPRALPAGHRGTPAPEGQRRVMSFMPDVRTRYVQEDELRHVDPELRSFVNANTPEEWGAALDLLRRALNPSASRSNSCSGSVLDNDARPR